MCTVLLQDISRSCLWRLGPLLMSDKHLPSVASTAVNNFRSHTCVHAQDDMTLVPGDRVEWLEALLCWTQMKHCSCSVTQCPNSVLHACCLVQNDGTPLPGAWVERMQALVGTHLPRMDLPDIVNSLKVGVAL